MKKNLVLVGLMGAGKTTVGHLLAEKMQYEFLDTDAIIEQEQGVLISAIFAQKGEAFFRQIESDVIKKVSDFSEKIISTGGGACEKDENIKALKKNSILVYLQASPDILFERIKNQNHRPLLQTENPLSKLQELLNKREKNYLQSDIIMTTENKKLEQIVEEIIEVYNARA